MDHLVVRYKNYVKRMQILDTEWKELSLNSYSVNLFAAIVSACGLKDPSELSLKES